MGKVVYRQGLTDEAVQIKAWLLRLSETEQGNFYWDDFVSVCGSCKEMLSSVVQYVKAGKELASAFSLSVAKLPFGLDAESCRWRGRRIAAVIPCLVATGLPAPRCHGGRCGPGADDRFDISMVPTRRCNEVFVFPG
ncbi:unnamed protein product [Cladocopium goreaui]|uniref:Uncharacterized protein n=1 Tax=Cladocopium goreaui TaxID=2562237 RepID=A0A9P1C507_9DINO|nr:unnamed protein product [Cladocopium goreaui]